MSVEIEMYSSTDEVDFPYRAMSSTAIASVILAVLALLVGLFFWPGLALAAIGVFVGTFAFFKIRRYPKEFAGGGIAATGIGLNVVVLVAGIAMHSYIYLTEVPDGYSRVQFYELQQKGSGADQPTQKAVEISGEPIFLKGYIHPSSGSGMLKHFILVPDLGTCCFGGQPDSTDMIEVTLAGGQTTKAGMRKKKLAGTFMVGDRPHDLADFDNNIFYRMRVDQIK